MTHGTEYTENRRMSKRSFTRRIVALLFSIVFVICCAAGSTIAWLSDSTKGITNTFTPGTVDEPGIEEDFTPNTGLKENVKISVPDETDTNVYVRVRLVSYYKDADSNITGPASIPEDIDWGETSTNGDGAERTWIKCGDYYYYTTKVIPGQRTANLIDSCQLDEWQALTILTETIQSDPIDAAQESWGVEFTLDESTRVITEVKEVQGEGA